MCYLLLTSLRNNKHTEYFWGPEIISLTEIYSITYFFRPTKRKRNLLTQSIVLSIGGVKPTPVVLFSDGTFRVPTSDASPSVTKVPFSEE